MLGLAPFAIKAIDPSQISLKAEPRIIEPQNLIFDDYWIRCDSAIHCAGKTTVFFEGTDAALSKFLHDMLGSPRLTSFTHRPRVREIPNNYGEIVGMIIDNILDLILEFSDEDLSIFKLWSAREGRISADCYYWHHPYSVIRIQRSAL